MRAALISIFLLSGVSLAEEPRYERNTDYSKARGAETFLYAVFTIDYEAGLGLNEFHAADERGEVVVEEAIGESVTLLEVDPDGVRALKRAGDGVDSGIEVAAKHAVEHVHNGLVQQHGPAPESAVGKVVFKQAVIDDGWRGVTVVSPVQPDSRGLHIGRVGAESAVTDLDSVRDKNGHRSAEAGGVSFHDQIGQKEFGAAVADSTAGLGGNYVTLERAS